MTDLQYAEAVKLEEAQRRHADRVRNKPHRHGRALGDCVICGYWNAHFFGTCERCGEILP